VAGFLEIAVKPAGRGRSFQQFLPRQAVTSAPYNIRSLSTVNCDLVYQSNDGRHG
jgi:hypothetical protein